METPATVSYQAATTSKLSPPLLLHPLLECCYNTAPTSHRRSAMVATFIFRSWLGTPSYGHGGRLAMPSSWRKLAKPSQVRVAVSSRNHGKSLSSSLPWASCMGIGLIMVQWCKFGWGVLGFEHLKVREEETLFARWRPQGHPYRCDFISHTPALGDGHFSWIEPNSVPEGLEGKNAFWKHFK